MPNIVSQCGWSYPQPVAPYFIYGQLVFLKVTTQFRSVFNDGSNVSALNYVIYNKNPLAIMNGEEPTSQREEFVTITSPFSPQKLTKGYSTRSYSVIASANDQPIRSLRHLVSVLRDLKDDQLVIRFDEGHGDTLVLPRKELLASTEEILPENGVRAQSTLLIRVVDAEKVPKRHPAINMAVRNKTTFFGQNVCFSPEKHVKKSDRIKLCQISNPSSLRKSRLAA